MILVSLFNKFFKIIINVLFPEKCIGCQQNNNIFCQNCLIKIEKSRPIEEKNIFAVFDYRNSTIRKAIWELKYHKNRHLGNILGEVLYESMIEEVWEIREFSDNKKIIIIPVPISRVKIFKRGYNQSLIIALGFCKKDKEKIFKIEENIIFKKNETKPQAKITNRKQRLSNVKNSFGIKNENYVKNRTIIVIDDVVTTGATIKEIMKILKKAGASKIFGFALAH